MRFAVLALGLLGCSADVGAPPDVVWSVGGCFSLLEGGRCYTRETGRVVLWVQDERRAETLVLDGTTPEYVEGGWRWIVPIEASRTLKVEDALGRVWVDLGVENTADGWRDASYQGARCEEASADFDADELVFYASGRGRCGDEAERLKWLETAIAGHRERGDTLRFGWDQSEWERIAETGSKPPGGLWLPSATGLEARYLWLLHHGRTANAMGNLADAQRFLHGARRSAAILDRDDGGRWLGAVLANQINNLIEAGRLDAASRVADTAVALAMQESGDRPSCELTLSVSNRMWIDALRETAPADRDDPLPTDELEALVANSDACPAHARAGWHLSVNLAAILLAQGRAREAAESLSSVSAAVAPDDLSAAWHHITQARLALATNQPDQVEAILAHLLGGERASPLSLKARALAAQARQALGDTNEAIEHLQAIERDLPAVSARAPLSHGQGAVIDTGTQAARRLAALMVEKGRPDEALQALRRNRNQVLYSLQQADRVSSLGELRGHPWSDYRSWADPQSDTGDLQTWASDSGAPEDSGRGPTVSKEAIAETLLIGAPGWDPSARGVGADELVVLADAHGNQATVWWWTADAPPRRATFEVDDGTKAVPDGLVGILEADLQRTGRVTWLPMAAARDWSLAQATWKERPLGVQRPIALSLDLRPRAAWSGLASVAVIADPDGTLASARREGRSVAEALAMVADTSLLTGDEATESATWRALDTGTDIAHFAGHATFGDDGWDAAIQLADGERLAVWQLLGLEHPPKVVSMTACESSRSESGNAERLGLAQALIVAGTDVVVAADIPVPDDLSSTFGQAWARSLAAGDHPDLAWMKATRATWQAHPDGPWWAFKMWTP